MLLGAGSDSEDVVQEAFVKATESCPATGATRPSGHGCSRSSPTRPATCTAPGAGATGSSCGPRQRTRRSQIVEDDAVGAVLAGERRTSLVQALRQLPVRDREVIVCRFFLDLSEEETVAALGWPRGTVKSRTSRALAKLRGLLDREEVRHG